jgi:hypothetical protein
MATMKLSISANVTTCRPKAVGVVRASYSAFRCVFVNVSTSSPSVGFDLAHPELPRLHRLISRPNVNSTSKRLQQLSASTATPLPTLAPPATASADAGEASGTCKRIFQGRIAAAHDILRAAALSKAAMLRRRQPPELLLLSLISMYCLQASSRSTAFIMWL